MGKRFWRRGSVLLPAALVSLGLSGCKVNLDVAGDLQDLSDDLQNLWDDITELSEPQDTFGERVLIIGRTDLPDGSAKVYLQGADASGKAIVTADFEDLQVFVDGELVHGCESVPVTATEPPDAGAEGATDADGGTEEADPPAAGDMEERCVALAGLEIKFLVDLEGTVLSISVVNDYSGSMADSDLELVSEIHTALFDALPPVFEAEVVYFSEVADTVLPFTDDRAGVLAAVEPDPDYERGLTALYDGMGAGLATLTERDAPVRILMVSSDGHENASDKFTKAQLIRTIDDSGVIPVMLGSRFANVDELSEFTKTRGVFFYTPAFRELRARVTEYVDSLLNAAEVTLPPELEGKDVEVRVDGIPVQL